jgi:hypothetical protein
VEERQKQLAPIYFFLASNLNVELVYSILKGITSFGYVTLCKQTEEVERRLSTKRTEKLSDGMRMTFNHIKVKERDSMRQNTSRDFI